MAYRFTERDVGKTVLTSEGSYVGTVEAVEEARATVDCHEGVDLAERLGALLGVNDDGDGTPGEIRYEHVDRVRAQEIYLRRY
jgi:hypothetical protein